MTATSSCVMHCTASFIKKWMKTDKISLFSTIDLKIIIKNENTFTDRYLVSCFVHVGFSVHLNGSPWVPSLDKVLLSKLRTRKETISLRKVSHRKKKNISWNRSNKYLILLNLGVVLSNMVIISEKSKERELRHKNVVYSLKSSSREVTIAQNAYHAVQPFEEGQVLSVIVLCCFAKTILW